MSSLGIHGLKHALRDERWSTITHGAGAVLSVAAAAVLISLAAVWGDGWQLASAIVFSITLVLLYTASTLFHAAPFKTTLKARLNVLDHCAIYLLIAGTYTPITLVGLREHGGWWLFGAIWTLAVVGVVFKLYTRGRFRVLSTLIYVVMGWLAVVAIEPMTEQLSTWALVWIVSGGVAYTLGTLFYLNRRIRYSHTIWHGFVLAGSGLHVAAVATQVWA
ncbi:hemolysin III family protein [Silanimonas sp.]|uniref:PAQR family membrane homeostasis protein TrhA n=1 Tax=Silanimonas sp. TaxID=1929290 RepID=UPI001BC82884|nr:hemolysin III family protein [Silanimonas sp.]MBS3897173.1 hemolysin III family protein [Silanimonas sp.]MBS3923874.1 hemolysin III family protein [Xanthomonadaceae bacterium]